MCSNPIMGACIAGELQVCIVMQLDIVLHLIGELSI